MLVLVWLSVCSSATTAASLQNQDVSVNAVPDLSWTRVRGTAKDIAVSANGVAFAVDIKDRVWRWRGKDNGGWALLPKSFTRVAADPTGKPWAISKKLRLAHRHNGLWWQKLGNQKVRDLAVGANGDAYAVTTNGGLARWNVKRKRWDRVAKGNLRRVSVDHLGVPWVIDRDGAIARFVDGSFDALPGNARDLGISPAGTVFAVSSDGLVARWDDTEFLWTTLPDISGAASIATGPGDFPWIVAEDAKIFGTDDFEVTKVEDEEKERKRETARRQAQIIAGRVTDTSAFEFTRVTGVAEDIAIGAEGSVYSADSESRVFRYNNARRRFLPFPGGVRRLAVAPDGRPWGVDSAGQVFRRDDRNWVKIKDIKNAREIAAGSDNSVFAVDSDQNVLAYKTNLQRFQDTGLNAVKVAVTPTGKLWLLRDNGAIVRCDTEPCETLPDFRAIDIAIGPDGSVFIVSPANVLHLYEPAKAEFTAIRANVVEAAVGPRGRPWIIDTSGNIFATRFFVRDESNDAENAIPTKTPKDIKPPAITFSKRLKFKQARLASNRETTRIAAGGGKVRMLYSLPAEYRVGDLDPRRNIFEFSNEAAAILITFPLVDIAVNDSGRIWYIGAPAPTLILIVQPTGSSGSTTHFISTPGLARINFADIAAGADGSVFLTDHQGKLRKFDFASDSFEIFDDSTRFVEVAVDPDGNPWIINGNAGVERYDTRSRSWRRVDPSFRKARNIAIGANGTAFVSGTDERLYRFNNSNGSFDRITGTGDVRNLAVDDDGLPWVVTGDFPDFSFRHGLP